MNRVLVTGIGALSVHGVGRGPLWEGLLRTPGCPLPQSRTLPAPPGLPELEPVQVAALPELDLHSHLGHRGVRALSEESAAWAVATMLACEDARLDGSWESAPGVGFAVGSTSAGLGEYAQMFGTRLDGGVERVNPGRGPMTGLNAPAAVASIRSGAAGPNLTHSAGRTAAVDALADAVRAIRTGTADLMLAGGVQLLSHAEVWARRSARPDFGTGSAARPFDGKDADPLPGEAAVTLVLEEASAARARGTSARAELLGAGAAFGPGAAVRAVRAALAEAGQRTGTSEVVPAAAVVSASGSPAVDRTEADALGELFDGAVPVCAVAGSVGDCAGATGAVQTAVAVQALESGLLPAALDLRRDASAEAVPLPRDGSVLVLAVDPLGHASALLLGGQPR